MSVSCECCVLSYRSLCDMLITHPEESYRLWCVISSAKKNHNVIAWDQITKSGSKNEPGSYICYHSVFLFLCQLMS